MVYIFDTSSLLTLQNYYPDQFPSFWIVFNNFVQNNKILSVKEAFGEIDERITKPHLFNWCKLNKNIFLIPDEDETIFLADIFKVPRFLDLVNQKSRLRNKPIADPFIIASAKIKNGCVVTEESKKIKTLDAPRIPNVCDYFNINYMNLEGFMVKEGWKF
ncbi:MAG: DUF4411 family protein [Nitrospirae bacterium]|nr:DUF4411 family protein [Nitrospirota bacterium]MBF0540466.1 DUF4411 family protein [Nitrospirota bacterium]